MSEPGKPIQDIHVRLIEAWREVRRGEAMQAYRDLQFAGSGITELGQSDALQLLGDAREMRVGELARAMRIERSTATRTVDRLESLGMAKRVGGNGREQNSSHVVVKLTRLGRETNRKIRRRRLELMAEMCEGLGEDRLEGLADALEALLIGLDRVVARHTQAQAQARYSQRK
jgi:DNA-binding MarR family transcriptional regulator